VGQSMFSLFQVMTLESWSMGIVRPVMAEYPWAWVFFVPFIIITSFAVLNLFIALLVNCIQSQQEAERHREAMEIKESAHSDAEELHREIRQIRLTLEKLTGESGR